MGDRDYGRENGEKHEAAFSGVVMRHADVPECHFAIACDKRRE